MAASLAKGLSPVRAELSNGGVVLVQETVMTPAVTISASFRAGSMFDPVDLPGLAYLTGRAIDRGTEHRSASMMADELDERGVSMRVSSNRQALTVSCTCLAEDFDDVLAIVADIVRNPAFPPLEIESRRSEALTILRQNEDNPAARAVDAVLELLYGWHHPYGRPPKGTVIGVESVSRADMVAFHAARVRPAAMSLAVVGDVRPDHALERARQAFDDWAAEPPAPATVAVPPLSQGRRTRVIGMPGKTQTDIAYGFTAIRRLDPRYYAYWMMNNVLGEFGLGGRLADNIRERQGMAYYAFSTLDATAGEAPLLVRAGVDPANVDRALAAIDHEVAALAAAGPTETELAETRGYLIGSIPRLLETNQSIAAFLQTSEEYGLGLDFDQRLPSLLGSVTRDDLHAAAADVLDPARAAIAVAGPAGSLV
jgi:zinc protease